ncbi:MAG TPA: carboxypeptidase regulatory-like domain-containing protein [Longimicrobiaceae bacterium]|nr:carboxypeptidase regulatory-like domain-containing protein [Longimicrobiaceae bacterium]
MVALRLRPLLRVLACWLVALCALGGGAVHARAQEGTSALLVTAASQASGSPVMGARVTVVGTGISGTTDTRGTLRMVGVPSGVQTVEVRRLGYATRLKLVSLEPGRSAALDFSLEVEAIPVAAIRVEAKARDWGAEYLEAAGFARRRRIGLGSFITRADLERRNPTFLSDALRTVPGIHFQPNGIRGDAYVTMVRSSGGPPCPIQYYVDGTLIGPGFNIDEIRATDVQGLEVYRGASQVPPEFNRRTAACGVIAVWTRPR